MSARAAGQTRKTKAKPDRAAAGKKASAKQSTKPPAPKAAAAVPGRRAYRVGRVCVFAIPIFAVLVGLGQFSLGRFATRPAEYAHYLATGRYSWLGIATTFGVGFFGIISIIGLTLVLRRGGGRWFAISGAIAGLLGAAAMLVALGTLVVRAPRVSRTLLHGQLADVVFNAHTRGAGTATIVLVGAGLLTIGWILLGLAVFLTVGLSQGDGGMLALSAPLVYLGGFFGSTLPTIGAFLLGAAGLGIAAAAGRLGAARGRLTPSVRVGDRAPVSSFAAFADDPDGFTDDEFARLSDEQIAAIYGGLVTVDASGEEVYAGDDADSSELAGVGSGRSDARAGGQEHGRGRCPSRRPRRSGRGFEPVAARHSDGMAGDSDRSERRGTQHERRLTGGHTGPGCGRRQNGARQRAERYLGPTIDRFVQPGHVAERLEPARRQDHRSAGRQGGQREATVGRGPHQQLARRRFPVAAVDAGEQIPPGEAGRAEAADLIAAALPPVGHNDRRAGT